ncbi:hypothetical protein [Streptomyces sp. bgisy091]|uniref:hypothetical protein n=1 Tax=Streptomyces sp. bgisy091 TaxID=3413778 RepID=UPI003D743E96
MKLATAVQKIATAPTGRLPHIVAVADLPTVPAAEQETADWVIGDRICDLDAYFKLRAQEAKAAGLDPATACQDDYDLITRWMRQAIARHTGTGE